MRSVVLFAAAFWVGMIVAPDVRQTAADVQSLTNGFRKPATEWCEGRIHCSVVGGVRRVSLPAPGFRLPNGLFVSEADTQQSPDGATFCLCTLDNSRPRLFVPPGT